MRCRHCGSEATVRNGRVRGAQRHLCRSCGRSFGERAPRFSQEIKAQALDMYLNNVGIRKVARFTGASPASVVNWIRKARERLAGQVRQAADTMTTDGVANVIEMDEIYTFVQKTEPRGHMDCL